MHQFTGTQGMNVDATGFSIPDFYNLYLSSDLINHFVIQTNLYAKQFKLRHILIYHLTLVFADDMTQPQMRCASSLAGCY